MRRRPLSAGFAGLAVAGLLAGCGSHSSGATPTTGSSTHAGTTAPARASLVLAVGATHLVVRAAAIDHVVDVSGAASSSTPAVSASGSTYTVHAGGSPTVTVDEHTLWTIEEDGGASALTVDLGDGHLATLDLDAGVSSVSVVLPAPAGTQQVVESGGVSSLDIRSAAPTRVQVLGGASSVILHGSHHSGIGGATTFTDPAWSSTADHVLVTLHGGVSSVVVSH